MLSVNLIYYAISLFIGTEEVIHFHNTTFRLYEECLNLLVVGIYLNMDTYRGPIVDSWTKIDIILGYHVNDELKISLEMINAFETEYYLVKNIGFPFDYKQEGRITSLKLNFNL